MLKMPALLMRQSSFLPESVHLLQNLLTEANDDTSNSSTCRRIPNGFQPRGIWLATHDQIGTYITALCLIYLHLAID